jgi:hypothetical protein
MGSISLGTSMPDPQQFLDIVLYQSKYHHEHEKFYAQAPLQQVQQMMDGSPNKDATSENGQ